CWRSSGYEPDPPIDYW
nr:immunoglobulin heavy chain junction region [Macaca mulatta]